MLISFFEDSKELFGEDENASYSLFHRIYKGFRFLVDWRISSALNSAKGAREVGPRTSKRQKPLPAHSQWHPLERP